MIPSRASPRTARPRPRPRPRPRRPSLAAALLLALTSGCAAIHPRGDTLPSPPVLPAGDPALTLSPAGIDVLVWNVKKAQRSAWPRAFEGLARGKELILLQEAYVPRMTEPLAARPELQWLMSPSFAYPRRTGSPTTGVVVGSTARALEHRAFITVDTEPLAGTPKAALAVTYALEDERLLVVCIHGINFRRAPALAAQLRTLEPVIREHRGPVIFAGDLNTHHRPRMEVLERFAADVGLRSVFDNRRGSRADRSASDERTRYRAWPLDHVYIRGLVVEDVRVVGGGLGSDHEPIILRLSSARPGSGSGPPT